MKHFHIREFDCTHTGTGGSNMDPEFLENLDRLRETCKFPFHITSGWRDATHPREVVKASPGTGTHCQGLAADIAVSNGVERMNIVHEALKMGLSVGVARTFIHVDGRKTTPVLWSYHS